MEVSIVCSKLECLPFMFSSASCQAPHFVLLLTTRHATVSVIFHQVFFLQADSLSLTQEHCSPAFTQRLNRDIYVVELTIKKTKSAIYPGSRTGYQLYPIRYRKLSTCVRGKYKVRGVRRNMNGQKRRRVLAVTALIKLGYGKMP